MLKQHSQLVLSLLILADAAAISIAWLAAYWIRFEWLYVDPAKGVPPLWDKYLPMLPLVALAHVVIFYRVRLYRPRRDRGVVTETQDIVKAFLVAVVAVVLIDYAMPESHKISRQFIATYAVVGTTCFAVFRATVRVAIRMLRQRGYNRRTAAIIGAGRTAQRLLFAIRNNAWTGYEVVYFVDDAAEDATRNLRGVPLRGPLGRVREIFAEHPVDAIFVALPQDQTQHTNAVLEALENCPSDLRLVPEIQPSFAMRPNLSSLDDVPIISLRQTPLYGMNALLKRGFDLAVGGVCLLIALLPMALIALLIKLTDPGPVFYRQRRAGLDGREFTMLKFRTMRQNAERSGPVWSQKHDPRRTRLGAFLRRTSLDELPNLFNVLGGSMSLVGPRPERPEFIAKFKDEIPRYLLRHKMKAGMTGYAQMRGWRGDTSLRKRIQHDLHYIRNWSIGLDFRILARTLGGVWFSRHET